ncbi:HET-domain-containing protein [Xylariomycetidae sp. FL0641]|nr:HET-domain-containing protein [Xylariomycetidae sp. FL0641]
MRLLNSKTYEVHEFPGDDASRQYAIFGYTKIKHCCDQARRDGLGWAWVDTCCIDKTSTAELSEAINSMFQWYRDATICYVYLSDIDNRSDIPNSRWCTRGWTLQELIAPRDMRFYSSSWEYLCSRSELLEELHSATKIEHSVLSTGVFSDICVARKMAWAANRQTTRIEDQAYSLLGIFDVNMPLLYGEGTKSFIRLQEEIIKVSDDHTLFAWAGTSYKGRRITSTRKRGAEPTIPVSMHSLGSSIRMTAEYPATPTPDLPVHWRLGDDNT